VGTWGIGAYKAAAIPQTRDFRNALGNHNDRPPEPGSARREAHNQKPPNRHSKGRLLKRQSQAAALKEGGTRGNQGFPRAPYIMSGIPPGIPAGAGVFSGGSATTASVVRMFFAIEAAF
jgi:hypothetical protein